MFSICTLYFAGQECAPQSVFNFVQSSTLTVSGDTACLACLFNGVSPQSGTVWFVNGQIIDSLVTFGQVNTNGTLLIRRPPGFNGEIVFSCEREGQQFFITLISE